MTHNDSKERLSRQYLEALERLVLAKQESDFDQNDELMQVIQIEDAFWLVTSDRLANDGFRFSSGLSFMQWFARLCEAGQARYRAEQGQRPFSFLMGPERNAFQSLVEIEPSWLVRARHGFDLIHGELAKGKKQRPDVRQANTAVLKVFDIMEGTHAQRPLNLFTEQRLKSILDQINFEIKATTRDLENSGDSVKRNIDQTMRIVETGGAPMMRSLSSFPGWERARERLSAYIHIKNLIEGLDS